MLNYQEEAVSAADSRNQLRQNMVATNRDNDIAALLPSGNYKDWVVKVVEIYARDEETVLPYEGLELTISIKALRKALIKKYNPEWNINLRGDLQPPS